MEKTDFRHDKEGVVAMARTSDPDSASCQFFIDLEPLPSLDPGGVDPYGYAIFGQVIDGMDVVKTIVKENVAPFLVVMVVLFLLRLLKQKMILRNHL